MAQIGYVFLQNYFHEKLSSVTGGAAVGGLVLSTVTPAVGCAAQDSTSASGRLSPASFRSIEVAPQQRKSEPGRGKQVKAAAGAED
jgi:hypothetical protein